MILTKSPITDHQPRRLSHTHGDPMDPVPTPDGEHVVFASGTTQPLNRDVFIASLDGEEQVQLTDRPLNVSWQPAVSPDGTKIAYVVEKEGHSDIHVMNIDGTGNANITNTNKGYWSPTWAADSKSLVVVSRDSQYGNLELLKLAADGSKKEQLTSLGYNLTEVRHSPDGEHLVFALDPGLGIPLLCSTKADGSDFKTYANELVLASTPSISPDGKVVFSGIDNNYKMSIYTVELNSDAPPQKVIQSDLALAPTFSPDGSRFAYMADDKDGNMQIFEANADGSGAHPVTEGDSFHSSPAYTPDGKSLVYVAESEVYLKQLRD